MLLSKIKILDHVPTPLSSLKILFFFLDLRRDFETEEKLHGNLVATS